VALFITLRRRILWECFETVEKLAAKSKLLLNIVEKSITAFTHSKVVQQQFICGVGKFKVYNPSAQVFFSAVVHQSLLKSVYLSRSYSKRGPFDTYLTTSIQRIKTHNL